MGYSQRVVDLAEIVAQLGLIQSGRLTCSASAIFKASSLKVTETHHPADPAVRRWAQAQVPPAV